MHRRLALAAFSILLAACQAQALVPATPSLAAPPSQVLSSPSPSIAPSPSVPASLAPSPTPSLAPSPTPPPSLGPSPTFTSSGVATRIVVSRLGIDLPVMFQTPRYGAYPLCDVAMYLKGFGQPGRDRATYIYAHARAGMFLPLLTTSLINNGQGMIGEIVEVYTGDNHLFRYRIVRVHRHALNLDDAFATRTEKVFLQTSEGPHGTIPKLQVIGNFVSVVETDWKSAHPVAHPHRCG